jgi:hypothetical protein
MVTVVLDIPANAMKHCPPPRPLKFMLLRQQARNPAGTNCPVPHGLIFQSLLPFHDCHASILSHEFNNLFFVSLGTGNSRATTTRPIGGARVSASKMFFTPVLPNPCSGQRVACDTAVFLPTETSDMRVVFL